MFSKRSLQALIAVPLAIICLTSAGCGAVLVMTNDDPEVYVSTIDEDAVRLNILPIGVIYGF
jgi:hypothetical protein